MNLFSLLERKKMGFLFDHHKLRRGGKDGIPKPKLASARVKTENLSNAQAV
jgi:hypothetical protein